MAADDVHPMIATKLWSNPCTLSFRLNFLAHHFNQPLYERIARDHDLTAPEHVVLYALGLREGITADDIVVSSARPKNTLSRAINALLARRLLRRGSDRSDRRRKPLYLTAQGRRIVEQTVPDFVALESRMLAALNAPERRTLDELLTKIVLAKPQWTQA